MQTLTMRRFTFVAMALIATLGMMPGGNATAEEPIASTLDASQASDFLGNWKIVLDIMGNKIELFINVVDMDGKVGATLDSQRQQEPLAISGIEMDGEEILLFGELTFGGSFTVEIKFTLHKVGDELIGKLAEKSGIFTSDIVGTLLSDENLGVVQGQRPSPTETRLYIDGKRVKITFGNMPTDGPDYPELSKVKDGEVYLFTRNRATKLFTDLDLIFGDVVVKTENVAKDYPGVYSLWLKKVGDGWHLVFNNQADIWGTRHMPEHDAVEIPLTMSKADEEQDEFLVELNKNENGGKLKLAWGDTEWSAEFRTN